MDSKLGAPCDPGTDFLCGLGTSIAYLAGLVAAGGAVAYFYGGKTKAAAGLGALVALAATQTPPVRQVLVQAGSANPWLG